MQTLAKKPIHWYAMRRSPDNMELPYAPKQETAIVPLVLAVLFLLIGMGLLLSR
jgi:hypothetical protein